MHFLLLKLTKLFVPQLATLSKSSLREKIVLIQDESLLLKEGVLGKIECKVESSAYEFIGLDVMDKKSLIKIRNSVGNNTQPYETLVLIG